MRFSYKIVGVSAILLLLTVGLLSVQQQSTVKSEVEGLVLSSLNEIENGVLNTIDAQLSNKKSLALAITQAVQMNPNDRQYVKQLLDQPAIKDSFLAVGFGYEADGSIVDNDPNWDPGAGYVTQARPWFTGPKQTGGLIITDPYIDVSTGNTIVSIATPVYQQGTFIGAMYFDMELEALANLVNSANLLDAGYLLVLAADGTAIAHPQAENNGKKIRNFFADVNLQDSAQRVTLEGTPYMVIMRHYQAEDWYIVSIVDEDKALAALAKLRNSSILFTTIGVIISVFVLMFLIKVLMRPLDSLNSAIQEVASGKGDLTKRIEVSNTPEFASLAQGFNTFTESLQLQIQQLKQLGDEIVASGDETVLDSQKSAQATSKQMQELDLLATAIHEMAMSANEVAQSAQHASEAALEVDKNTIEGSKVVSDTALSIDALSGRIEQAVEQVQKLETATANIETVLSVINDIADQTNLLALNAAIEAARAGESGRGFAVVADEVRTLAQRTQESTTEIRDMIEQLQAGSGAVAAAMDESRNTASDAVEKARFADESLQNISAAIERISTMNVQIASAAQEQSHVAEDISGNAVKIKDLSTEVSELAQSSNESMENQRVSTSSQKSLLDRFVV
ncbi:Methyl-accepting chemotaxis protein PctB [Marinomonas aquimarina]|uniref:Methyl-accepting chemotaxis protein PctB n=1 Tax=Marinomonas aquimarina TaxID=295068 RepID=A0A1A8TQQ3_9GAMM|nr:methyl-accepting chemotaxis protein [Marinomonas aquimarina]SBS35172.1 Methyl-accepting chemotaxis protein PctB [Marinomonas aquimarina]